MFKNHRCLIISLVLTGLFMPLTTLAQPVYGPVTLERTPSQPSKFSDTFLVCNPAAEYQLVVDTNIGTSKQVSSATVTLNGIKVVRPNDFKQQVDRIEKEVTLSGENRLEIDLAGIPGTALAFSIECVSGCLDLAFDQPIEGATLESSQTLTTGRVFNGTGEIGVSLKVAADESSYQQAVLVDTDHFYAPVALQPGINTLTVTATDTCGYQVENTIAVHAEAPAITFHLSAWPPSGLIDYDTGKLTVDLTSDIDSSNAIASYAWDVDGDGTVDQSGSELDEITTGFSAPGVYLPTLTVTTVQGKTAAVATVVQVYDAEHLDALIQPKWAGVTTELAQGDIDSALRYFYRGEQSHYRDVLKKLQGNFDVIFSAPEELRIVSGYDNRVEYENLVIEGDKAYSYPVVFVRDESGLWSLLQL